MTGIGLGWRSGLMAAAALLCLGLLTPFASAVEFKYTLDPEFSLTGDCSTAAWDLVPDPDCEPTYPPPPDGPSGRFDQAIDIAVDDWGNQYVASRSGDGTEGRIDVFDPEGHFITELEDPLGPNSAAVDGEGNLYVYEKLIGVLGAPKPAIVRYPPTTYNPAAGEIAYDPGDRTVIVEEPNISLSFNGLAIDRADPADPADDRLYIAERSRIRIYSSAKTGNALVDTLVEPEGAAGFKLFSAKTIAVDAVRRLLLVSTCKEGLSKCVVWVFDADAPYDFVAEINGSQTPAGKFFSTEGRISIAVDETNGHVFIGDLAARDDIFELDENYDFVSTFEIPGGATGAELQSDVAENPKNPDPEDKNPNDNYRYLYVPLPGSSGSAIAFAPPDVTSPIIKSVAAENIGGGEAELEALIHPGQRETTYTFEYVTQAQYEIDGFASATSAGSGLIPGLSSPQRVSALLSGLEPGQSYRFLVTAENELGEADPKEGSFSTFDDAPIGGPCANDALRTGLSAALPDCRAWELVTPPGARGPGGYGFQGAYFGALQASPDGNAMSFQLNAGPLPGTDGSGSFHGDSYLATRSATGWSTELAGPTGTMSSKPKQGSFSPDQGYSFWTAEGEGTALEGLAEPVYYVRYPDGHSEIVGRGSLGTDPRAQGKLITENGTHIVFQTFNDPSLAQQLEPNAPEEGITAVYDRTADETTHVVSLLPGEVTPTKDASYVGASDDGEGIAFAIGTTLYLRVGNAVTHEIGTGVTYAGISAGGERIFYLEGGDLKAFDVSSEEVIDYTGAEISTAIPVNVAPQGNRAYFVSETATGGANPNGDTAQPGEQNLYLTEEGAISFVATVTERDVEGTENKGTGARGDGLGLYTESLIKQQPAIPSSRLTPDGQVFVFQSRANLDGYDSGEDAQIYRYEVGERLHCVSCPPSKTAATGGADLQSLLSLTVGAPLSPYAFVPALRADGLRLFFESTEALVSGDTDGLRDVYEWEEDGVGSCARAGGCVYLISSGGSSHPDFLFGHSASGDDVFVSTYDVLVGSGEETIRIYDARVGGGFAQTPPKICMYIDECRPPATPPPALPQIGIGPSGNFNPPKPKKCPPGKRKVQRKGRTVCVKKHKNKRHKKQHRASAHSPKS